MQSLHPIRRKLPESSPAVLCGIAHMQSNDGVWYPRGGTGAVPKALTKLALSLGVEIRRNTAIRQIIVKNNRAVGVLTADGETIRGGAVVSNSDSVRTHQELLDGRPQKRFLGRRNYEPACSGVVLYLGLTGDMINYSTTTSFSLTILTKSSMPSIDKVNLHQIQHVMSALLRLPSLK